MDGGTWLVVPHPWACGSTYSNGRYPYRHRKSKLALSSHWNAQLGSGRAPESGQVHRTSNVPWGRLRVGRNRITGKTRVSVPIEPIGFFDL